MKKLLILLMVFIFAGSILFIGTSCKSTTAATTIAETTAAVSVETTAVATTSGQTTAATTAAASDLASKAADEYSKAAAEGKITIEIWDWQNTDNYGKAFDEIFALYKQKFPDRNIEFKRQALAYDSYTQQMKAAVTGGMAPPIYEAYPGPELIGLATSARLLSLSDFIDNDAEWKSWLGQSYNYPELRSTDGKIYLSPVDVFVQVIFYYKDVMAQAGITNLPKTIDDLIAMVAPLKAKGQYVLASGLADAWQFHEPFYHMVRQQQPEGTDMIAQAMNGEISWQNDVFANAINAYKKLYDGKIWRPDEISLSYNVDAIANFTGKKAWGFWEAGDWYTGSMNADDLANDNIGILPFPLVNDKSVSVYGAGTGLGYVINVDTKYPNLSAEFLKFVASPECANVFIKNVIHPASGFTKVPADITISKLFSSMLDAGIDPNIRKSSPYVSNADAEKQIDDGERSVVLGQDTTENVLKKLDAITYKK